MLSGCWYFRNYTSNNEFSLKKVGAFFCSYFITLLSTQTARACSPEYRQISRKKKTQKMLKTDWKVTPSSLSLSLSLSLSPHAGSLSACPLACLSLSMRRPGQIMVNVFTHQEPEKDRPEEPPPPPLWNLPVGRGDAADGLLFLRYLGHKSSPGAMAPTTQGEGHWQKKPRSTYLISP